MHITFTRLGGPRYRVDVVRHCGPPACMQVTPSFTEALPHDIAHFVVEREFALPLGIFGQLAAGGDPGAFWCAPADRNARLAQRAHRLRVAGRGDLGRSERLVASCLAAWEIEAGRRPAAATLAPTVLHDASRESVAQIARVVGVFAEVASAWSVLEPGGRLQFEWPAHLTLRPSARLRSA